jgi:cupin 2 domain-containing protein
MAPAMTEIPRGGNLFARLPRTGADEDIAALLTTPNVRIERIVSTGQASPPGFWWDQEWAEWVVLLTGSARLRFEGEAGVRALEPGDYLHIPAHLRHRVEWTHPSEPTVWLAVHVR